MNEELTLLSPPHLYPEGFPRHFTIKTITAELRLETIGAENLDQFLIDEVFPKCVIPVDGSVCDYKSLLLIDYHWICRALRIVSYGAIHFVSVVLCTDVGENKFGCKGSDVEGRIIGDHRVSLSNIGFRQPPADCPKTLEIKAADVFVDWKWDLSVRFPRVGDMLHARKDSTFRVIAAKKAKGEGNIDAWDDPIVQFAYSITHCNNKPVEDRRELYTGLAAMSDLDFDGLVTEYNNTFGNYGIEMSGTLSCPKCGKEARFYAPVEERFLRPTVRDKKVRRKELIKAKKSKQPVENGDINSNPYVGEESKKEAV
jgi:hypothetical protein